MYRLTIRKQGIKALRRMRARDARRVRGELDKLAQNPGGRDIDVTPLRARPGFRLRVGPWRVISSGTKRSEKSTCCASARAATFTKSRREHHD